MPQTEYAAPVSQGDQDSTVLRKIAYAAQNGSGGGGLTPSGVTPGSYTNTNLTVDANGIITAASDGFDPASPGPIGGTTPASGAFTTLSATPGNDATGLTLTGGTITGSGTTPFASVTGTWNTTGAASVLFANITDTASDAAAKLINLQIGSSTRFAVNKYGGLEIDTPVGIDSGDVVNIFCGRFSRTAFVINANGEVSFPDSTVTFANAFRASNEIFMGSGNDLNIRRALEGQFLISNPSSATVEILLGGSTNAFPKLNRSSAILQARLADDSAFTVLQATLRTSANAVAETPTATHTLVIQDATGTAYKVLALAA